MFTSCLLFYSLLAGIDPILTQAIIQVESNGNPFALGRNQDSGLMQIRHKLVPETQQQLFQGCTNIKRGVALLKQAREKCKHKLDNTWLVCYNAGLKGGSKLKHPSSFIYYKKVMSEMKNSLKSLQ
jgi:soluble lytic murein transglycosylase-like protein